MNNDEISPKIKKAIDSMTINGDCNPFKELLDQTFSKSATNKEKIDFALLVMEMFKQSESAECLWNNDMAEPYYSIFKEIFTRCINVDSTKFLKVWFEDREDVLTPGEMMLAHTQTKKNIFNKLILDRDGLIFEVINSNKKYWEIQLSLRKSLKSILSIIDDNRYTEEIMKKLELPKECEYLRHAESHTRISHNSEKKLITFKNFHPKKQKVIWEEELTYEEIFEYCSKVIFWINGFMFAFRDVAIQFIINEFTKIKSNNISE